MAERCSIHRSLMDPETGCDDCARDDLLDCPICEGTGWVETRHPAWGQAWCPDDYILTPCDHGRRP